MLDSFAFNWLPVTSAVPKVVSSGPSYSFFFSINDLPTALACCVFHLFVDFFAKCCKTIISSSNSCLLHHDMILCLVGVRTTVLFSLFPNVVFSNSPIGLSPLCLVVTTLMVFSFTTPIVGWIEISVLKTDDVP